MLLRCFKKTIALIESGLSFVNSPVLIFFNLKLSQK
jgi:hypothetical protein